MRGNNSNQLTGSHNTALGYSSLALVQGSGDKNTAICNITSGSNNICIGYNVDASTAGISNEVTIGDANITKFRVRC